MMSAPPPSDSGHGLLYPSTAHHGTGPSVACLHGEDRSGMSRMELRQLRYFVALAQELHFGRAAAREHIGQSSLSQQLQHLERELGVVLLERTTHHVRLTAAGAVFLIDARQILAQVDRATTAAQRAAGSTPSLRVGIVDASYDSMPGRGSAAVTGSGDPSGRGRGA